MDLKGIRNTEQKPVSVFEGDGFCISKILARKSSVGQSSRIFYRASEGIPFKWEMQPGTPKNPQEEDILPPLSPPPSMRGFGLPLPNVDHDELKGSPLKTSKIVILKRMLKRSINLDKLKKVEILSKRRSKQEQSSRFEDSSDGEFVASVKDLSFSSHSSSSSSASNGCVLDSSRFPRDSMMGPFCCTPGNITDILDEDTKRIYFCVLHKLAVSVEEQDNDFSLLPSNGEWNEITPGVPFKWEMQQGTPKNEPPENDAIPLPSPPPAVQLALPRPRVLHDDGEKAKASTWTKALFWIKAIYKTRKTKEMHHEISFRYYGNLQH